MAKRKFRKEKHIKERYSNKTKQYSFQVFFEYYDNKGLKNYYSKTFSEKDYITPGEALDEACKHRDKMIYQRNTIGIANQDYHSLKDVFELSKDLLVVSMETKRKHDLNFYKYIYNIIGDKDIKKITALDIYKTLNNMVSDCADDTIKRVFSIWKRIFKTARVHRLVDIDVTDEVIAPKTKRIKKKKDVTTNKATLSLVINALRNRTKQNDKYIFNTEMIIYGLKIMFFTGIRPSECYALKKENIDLINNTITIESAIGSTDTETNVLVPTKTETSVRTIPIVEELQIVLKALLELQDHDTFLLVGFNGELLNMNEVVNKINYACKKEGIKFNQYRLRHQFSTDLVTDNQDLRTIMELMGHNNPSMTIEYARSNDDLKIKALKDRKLS